MGKVFERLINNRIKDEIRMTEAQQYRSGTAYGREVYYQ